MCSEELHVPIHFGHTPTADEKFTAGNSIGLCVTENWPDVSTTKAYPAVKNSSVGCLIENYGLLFRVVVEPFACEWKPDVSWKSDDCLVAALLAYSK